MLLLIQCPRTHRHFSIGLEMTRENFELLPAGERHAQCPFCRNEHGWRKHDAILVEPNRWSEVPEVEDCFIKAMKNAELAAAARKQEQREFHHRMERKWLGLAEGYRFLSEVARRHD